MAVAEHDDRRARDDVAGAIDRVLESERAARAAVADCQRECEEALEQARRERRRILERAQGRIAALHARAAAALARRAADIRERRRQITAQSAEQLSDAARRHTALADLAARLTGGEPDDHAA